LVIPFDVFVEPNGYRISRSVWGLGQITVF